MGALARAADWDNLVEFELAKAMALVAKYHHALGSVLQECETWRAKYEALEAADNPRPVFRRYAPRVCGRCRKPYVPTGSRSQFCTTECRDLAAAARVCPSPETR